MRSAAASIWTVIAVGSVLNAAEPMGPAAPEGVARPESSTGFIDLTAVTSAESAASLRLFARSAYDPQERSEARGPAWLFDAMNRHTDAEAATFDDLISEVQNRTDRAGRSRETNSAEAVAPRANPFAGFMASWMTPKDYALLQVETSPAPAGTARHEQNRGVSNREIHNRRAVVDNPYLAAQQPARDPVPEKPQTARAPLVPFSQATPGSAPSLPAPVGVTTPAPDRSDRSGWQPASSDDRKYYPQLNRF